MTTRPPNCRIFLGNLPSERTSREELNEIFSKYGTIVEEIVLRRSFGFIQYDNPESAMAAIRGENGRIIGGMRVDINLADNREPKKRNEKEKDNRRDKRRSPSPPSSRRRTRDDYEYRENGNDNESEERRKRQYGGAPQFMSSPMMQSSCQIIYLGQQEKDYAYRVGQLLSQQIPTLRVDYTVTERRNLPQAIDKAKLRFRYIVVIGKFHQSRQTVDLHIIRQQQPEVFTELSYLEAVEKIRAEEQRFMFAQMPMGNSVVGGPSTGAYAYVNPAFLQQLQSPNLQQQQLLQLLQQTQMQQNQNTLNSLVGGSGLLPTPFPTVGSLSLPSNQNTINQPSLPGTIGNPNIHYQNPATNNPSDLFSLLNNSQILQSLNTLSTSQGSNVDNKSSRNISLPNNISSVPPTNNSLSSLYSMMASNPQLDTSGLNPNLARPESTAVNLNGNVGPRPSPSPSNVTIGSTNTNPGLLGAQNNEMLASLLSKLSGATNIPGSGNLNANFTQSISSQGPNNPNYGVLGSPPLTTESQNQGSEEYSPYAPSLMGNSSNPLGSILSRKS